MAAVLIALAVVAVVVIALVTVGGVVGSLSKQPPLRVFSVEEAVTWVADRLPDEATAVLSFDDVHAVIGWAMDFYESKGVAREATTPDPDKGIEAAALPGPPQIVDDAETLAYVLLQIEAAGGLPDAGTEVRDTDLAAVLEATEAYLAAIGAVGSAVDAPPDPSGA